MRIAIVVNSSWNIYNFRLGLAKALMDKGIEVIAIAPEDAYSSLLIQAGLAYSPVSVDNKGSNPFKDLVLMYNFYQVFKKTKPDCILQFTIKPNVYGTLAAKLLGIPVINNVSGLGTVFLHNTPTSFIAKLLYKISFTFPAKVFFQNKEDLALFCEKKLIHPSKTGLLPGSGVNTSHFVPKQLRPSTSPKVFLMVARLLYDKGVVEYIEAIKLLRSKGMKATFRLLGAIDESASLGISKKQLDTWVASGLLDYRPFTNALLEEYYQADFCVLPSYREGTPKSLLEAAACGLPLVATNVPGCKEVVLDGVNGFLCAVKNPVDLAAKLELIYSLTDKQYEAFSSASRAHILKNFDEKLVINMYFRAINETLPKADKLYNH